jgi:hypothetical protein
MRKFILPFVLLTGLLIGWHLQRGLAATASVDRPTLYNQNLHAGDHIRLYLSHLPTVDNSIVEGVLSGYDGNAFEVNGETTLWGQSEKGPYLDHKKLIWIVPAANVLYVEKTISEQTEPTTKP